MEPLSKILKDARYRTLMTKNEAAQRFGITVRNLEYYENGKLANPSFDFIKTAHEIYGIPYIKLMGWNEEKNGEELHLYLARSMEGSPDRDRAARIIEYMKKAAEKEKT